MLAQQNITVTDLNARAQAYRISTGQVTGRKTVHLRDGLDARHGDTIVTRQNDSLLRTDQRSLRHRSDRRGPSHRRSGPSATASTP